MTTARETLANAARQNGWADKTAPDALNCEPVEYRRRTGRATEVVRVVYNVYGRVVEASWAPSINGPGGRSVGKYDRDKAQWVLRHITRSAKDR